MFELRMRDRVSLLLYLQKHVPAKKLPVETKMNLPSREECEGWDPAQVAFFLGQKKMPECAGTVNRLRIDGHRLLCGSLSDVQGQIVPQCGSLSDVQGRSFHSVGACLMCRGRSFHSVEACLMCRGRSFHRQIVPQCGGLSDVQGQIVSTVWSLSDVQGQIVPQCGSLSDSLSDSDMNKFSLVYQPLKSKPVPKVPARDYRGAGRQLRAPAQPQSLHPYALCFLPEGGVPRQLPEQTRPAAQEAPPPGQRLQTAAPRTPLQGSDEVTQLFPPKHLFNTVLQACLHYCVMEYFAISCVFANDECGQLTAFSQFVVLQEDYINPDCSNDDDNYIEPAENPPSNPMMHCGSKAGRDHPMRPTPITERSPSPDFYEVPDKEGNSLSLPANRSRSPQATMNMKFVIQKIEVPNTTCKPKPEFKPREFESRTLPVMQKDLKPQRTAFTLDPQRPNKNLLILESTVNKMNSMCGLYPIMTPCWDGAFMVRRSSGQDAQQPYTLVVFYKGRFFSSISHIVENHQRTPLLLIDSQSNSKDAVRLSQHVTP
ncbi:hypothetical protein F7725_024421 [Dissostichus mawsoni]|uniref:SH2 domain-containing protein n=1 Tax=Dissostichus mawsoni TaxID=36200 RepID=A0A7J5XZH2_DISMA|nr:hypothetical protein F7725_024421 [Dissostichus mawsoni]